MAQHKSRQIVLFRSALFVLVMLFGISSCQASTGESAAPAAVVAGFIKTQNAGDVEASVAFLTDDAIIQLVPPPFPGDDGIFTGKEEIRSWYENTAKNNGYSELKNVQITGDEVTALLTYIDDDLKEMGLDSIENEWVVTVKNGLIQGYQATMTEASIEKLMAALAAAEAE